MSEQSEKLEAAGDEDTSAVMWLCFPDSRFNGSQVYSQHCSYQDITQNMLDAGKYLVS